MAKKMTAERRNEIAFWVLRHTAVSETVIVPSKFQPQMELMAKEAGVPSEEAREFARIIGN
ncbi:MAG: hypothetical protein Q8O94_00810 [bacterium]|nr:hypothetical protein [bacterium]